MARLTAITNTRALYNASASSLNDSSGNGYNLSASGTAVYESGYEGSANLAFDFNSSWYAYRSGDFGLVNTDNITVQFRVKVDTAPSSGSRQCFFVLTTNDAFNSRRCISVEYQNNGGTYQLQLRHGGSLPLVNQTLTTGTWYKIALVIDYANSTARAYVGTTGGGNPTEVLNTSLAAANSGNSVGLQIGANMDGSVIPTGNALGNFSIDNLRIGKFARTQSEVNSDFADSTTHTATLTETVTTSASIYRSITRPLTESLTATASVLKTASRPLLESITASASVLKSTSRTLTESASSSQGPNSPGTVVDDSSVGTKAWTNPGNAASEDGSYASITGSYDSGADIHDNAIKIVKSDGSIGTTNKSIGKWSSGGVFAYVSAGGTNDVWGETWTATDINSSNFGVVLQTAGSVGNLSHYIKATNFGFSIQSGSSIDGIKADFKRYQIPGNSNFSNGRLDHIRITVYYSIGGVTLSDTFTGAASNALTETITIADTMLRSTYRSITETISAADSLIKSAGHLLTEGITVADSLLRSTLRPLAEAVTAADAIVRAASRTLSETTTATDTAVRQAYRTLSEALMASDIIQSLIVRAKTLSDSITSADTFIRSLARSLSESITLTATLSSAGALFATLSETITASDTLVRSAGKVLSDGITAADSFIRSMARTISESVSASDALTTVRSFLRTISEAVSPSDIVLKTAGRVLSETAATADSFVRSVGRTLSETLSASDALTKVRTAIKQLSETITASDTFSRALTIGRTFAEAVALKATLFVNGSSVLWIPLTAASAVWTAASKGATATWTALSKAAASWTGTNRN